MFPLSCIICRITVTWWGRPGETAVL